MTTKHVVVVGGGLGGLSAAAVAAARGHRVTLLDKNPWLGGKAAVLNLPAPDGSGEFRLGSQLVVREGQRAVFVRDGKALDDFGPGRHTISTNNIPLLTALIGLPLIALSRMLRNAGFDVLAPRAGSTTE